jgi:hypothetical protein
MKDITSRVSSVGIAKGYRLNGRDSIPGSVNRFSLFHSIWSGPGAHPASYSLNTGVSSPAGKTAVARS